MKVLILIIIIDIRLNVKVNIIINIQIELLQWSFFNSTSLKLEFPPLVKSLYPFDKDEEMNYNVNYELYYSYLADDINYMYSTCYLAKLAYREIVPYKENGRLVYYFHGIEPNKP